ncbi:helix-turn-helix transcriptional regulator [Catenuloplanes japonicus]|uniref:helix-turn-helix transcriptional regulator n=1 Tax=Catenuloplanes japonicus TaxID=33876 RepID=UPI0005247A4D|nr:helix-turn-helix transcriptional regulator [Catenuloplanes japonicus]
MDRSGLADFLRRRRAAAVPDRPGPRQTAGLRREEVAARAFISIDYYTRLEQRRGPRPSEQVAAALATALRLTADERDHLFTLIGHNPPVRDDGVTTIDPALRMLLESLDDSAAMVNSNIGQTLLQNPFARTLFGDLTRFAGLDRSGYYRWFARPGERDLYPVDVHEAQSRTYAASIRAAMDLGPDAAELAGLVSALLGVSAEFATLWSRHEVHACRAETTAILHPGAGRVDFDCHVVFGEGRRQKLLVLRPRPGAEAHSRAVAAAGDPR